MPPVSGDLATSIQKAWSGLLDIVSKVVSPDWGAPSPSPARDRAAGRPALARPVRPLGVSACSSRARRSAACLRGQSEPRGRDADGMARAAGRGAIQPAVRPLLSLRDRAHGRRRGPPRRALPDAPGGNLAARSRRAGNCGLVLTVRRGVEIAQPAGPPPGGAAISDRAMARTTSTLSPGDRAVGGLRGGTSRRWSLLRERAQARDRAWLLGARQRSPASSPAASPSVRTASTTSANRSPPPDPSPSA